MCADWQFERDDPDEQTSSDADRDTILREVSRIVQDAYFQGHSARPCELRPIAQENMHATYREKSPFVPRLLSAEDFSGEITITPYPQWRT